jgi:hypothetical protein
MAATAAITNQMKQTAPMILLDLPIPPGFAVDATDFDAMVSKLPLSINSRRVA